MEKISYRKEVEISNEYERELFNSECHDDGECSKSGTLSKLANIAAFANKFASDNLKNQVDEVANRVFGIYDIEDRLAKLVDEKLGGMEYCQFLGSKWGEDANLGDVVIETSDGVRDSLNKQIDKYSDRKPDVYRTEVNFYEDRKAGEVFNEDGHIKARALMRNLYNDKKVRDFLIDAVTSEIFNLEEKAKKEGYNNTRLTVYHDGRIEPVPNQIYAYLDDLPHDDLDKLIKTSKNTIDE